MRFKSLIAGLAGGIILAIIASLSGPTSLPLAQEPTSLSIDVIPTDNTPTSVVQIDSCASAQEGDTFDIDLVIENVTDLLAWELLISYDPDVLEIRDKDATLFLGANSGSDVIDLSEATPDGNGLYLLQSFDAAEPDSPDSGSGVLARLQLKAIGSGISPLTIDKPDLDGDGTPDQGPLLRNVAGDIIGDDDGDTLFDGPLSNAEIRVGEACPGEAPGATVLTSDNGGISLALLIGAIVGGVAAVILTAIVLMRRRAARI